MLEFVEGDLFDRPVDIRVNTVNCVGVMGAGVALAFKRRYPQMYKDYQKACRDGQVRPGHLHVWRNLTGDWIVNFPTKRDWREKSRYEDIESGLVALHDYLATLGKVSVSLPALGCGHGGLDWIKVTKMIKTTLEDVEASIFVYEPRVSREAGRLTNKYEAPHESEMLKSGGFVRQSSLIAGETESRSLYTRGDVDWERSRWIAVIPSRTVEGRERLALDAISQELGRAGHPTIIALIYISRESEVIARLFTERNISVVLLLPFGVLARKKITFESRLREMPHLTLVSLGAPLEATTKSLFRQATSLLLRQSCGLLISDPDPSFLKGWSGAQYMDQPKFYVRYGNLDIEQRRELSEQGMTPLGRHAETGAPNVDGLLGRVLVPASIEAASNETEKRLFRYAVRSFSPDGLRQLVAALELTKSLDAEVTISVPDGPETKELLSALEKISVADV